MSKSPEGAQRAMLALAFEPASEGFLYYRNRRSGGVPVTAAEREEYLAIPAMNSDTRELWGKNLAARGEVTPPRSQNRVRLRIYALKPPVSLLGLALITLVFGVNALGSGPLAVRLGFGILALLGGALLLLTIVAKFLKWTDRLGPFTP